MDGPDLLRALMARDGLNSNSLATKLSNQSMQSHVYRYLKGVAKEPKRDTLRPIAELFDVPLAAFYDPTLAEQVAAQLGLIEGATHDLPKRKSDAEQLSAALEVLTKALQKADKNTRIALEPLLSSMAKEPEDAAQKSQLILRLLVTDHQADEPAHDDRPTAGRSDVLIGGSAFRQLGDTDGSSNRHASKGAAKR